MTVLRRRTRLAAPVVITALVLSACGTFGGDDSDDDTTAGDTTGDTSFETVTIEHAFGTTEIDAKPQKVVALGWGAGDAAIALGTTPIALEKQTYGANDNGLMPWIQDAVEEAGDELPTTLTTGDSPAFAEIDALDPDLILANYSGITKADYDKLSQITDTVAYPETPWSTPWRDVITTVGQALGESDAADDLLAEIDGEVSAAAEAHPEFEGKSIAAVAIDPSAFYVYTEADPRVEFLTDLGFTIAPSVAELESGEGGFFYTLSTENVDQLTSDVLLSYAGDQASVDTIAADPTYQTMQQFKDGTVASVIGEANVSSVSPPTALSLTYSLDTFVEALSSAVPQG